METITLVTGKELFLNNLKFYMDEKGLSQGDIAKLVGFTRQQVTNLFNRESEGISTSTTDKIGLSLGLKETDLIDQDFILKYKKKTK